MVSSLLSCLQLALTASLAIATPPPVAAMRSQEQMARRQTVSSPPYFDTVWTQNGQDPLAVTLGSNTTFNYLVPDQKQSAPTTNGNLHLALMWSKIPQSSDPGLIYTVLFDLQYACSNPSIDTTGQGTSSELLCNYGPLGTGNGTFNLQSNGELKTSLESGYFFCLAASSSTTGNVVCESYSNFFDVAEPNPNAGGPVPAGGGAASTAVPLAYTEAITVTQSTNILVLSTASSTSVSVTLATVMSYTATVTVAPSATGSASSSSSSKSSSGLSTAAKAGIAVGAVGLVLIALLAAFCLCRRRKSRSGRTSSQPEQLQLTSTMRDGRDILAEKEEGAHAIALANSPVDDHDDHTPYNDNSTSSSANGPPPSGRAAAAGAAGAAAIGAARSTSRSNATPARNATVRTQHTNVSELSRGMSTASSVTVPMSAASEHHSGFNEPYNDDPVFGDSRHPGYNNNGSNSALGHTFLAEPGMSADDMARLEEEERRIDAAIAEAERR